MWGKKKKIQSVLYYNSLWACAEFPEQPVVGVQKQVYEVDPAHVAIRRESVIYTTENEDNGITQQLSADT